VFVSVEFRMGFTSAWRINVRIHLINAVAITRRLKQAEGEQELGMWVALAATLRKLLIATRKISRQRKQTPSFRK
jgi:hypothetical protein